MARRTWTRCVCGAKLHVKVGRKKCYKCEQKERKVINV